MTTGQFGYEDCLLKHHVRAKAWLPACKARRTALLARVPKFQRRLRYFTFCAVGALDVLMLELHKVLTLKEGRRDTVVFFDQDDEKVFETQKRIPGAVGFPGDFVKTVLLDDPDLETLDDALSPPELLENRTETRDNQRLHATHIQFFQRFPFDVINLDLEQFFFIPSDPFPGKLIKVLRKIFEWQKRPVEFTNGYRESLESFSLMFTTQVGPKNMAADYRQMLRECLMDNLTRFDDLNELLFGHVGHSDVARLESENFELFFKFAVPKIIARTLDERDWYVDGNNGIKVFEFQRASNDGPYTMLHIVLEVKRKQPTQEHRAPNADSAIAQQAYDQAVHALFTSPTITLTTNTIDTTSIQKDLDRVKALRKKVYPDGG